MPEADYGLVDESVREKEVGYDLASGRFGPLPGIRREVKQRLDAMDDEAFFQCFLKLGQEHRQSLMVCEWERRRTFRTRGWLRHNRPEAIGEEFAREGFYFVGEGDRTQCCFCSGFLGNWEPGDVVRTNHRQFFPHCKKARGAPVYNLPLARVVEKGRPSLTPPLPPPSSSLTSPSPSATWGRGWLAASAASCARPRIIPTSMFS